MYDEEKVDELDPYKNHRDEKECYEKYLWLANRLLTLERNSQNARLIWIRQMR